MANNKSRLASGQNKAW